METRDLANNSRIARRFVIFDDKSNITVNRDESKNLFVSSADVANGYTWQTSIDGMYVLGINLPVCRRLSCNVYLSR